MALKKLKPLQQGSGSQLSVLPGQRKDVKRMIAEDWMKLDVIMESIELGEIGEDLEEKKEP